MVKFVKGFFYFPLTNCLVCQDEFKALAKRVNGKYNRVGMYKKIRDHTLLYNPLLQHKN